MKVIKDQEIVQTEIPSDDGIKWIRVDGFDPSTSWIFEEAIYGLTDGKIIRQDGEKLPMWTPEGVAIWINIIYQ